MERSAGLRPAGIWPTVTLFGAATAAGFNWLPLRYFARQGLESAWAGLAVAFVSLLLLLPFLPWRGKWDRRLIASIWDDASCLLFFSVAISCDATLR